MWFIFWGNALSLNEEKMKKKIKEVAERVKIRLLTHRGKAVIINTIILSQFMVYGSIYIYTL
jgi:hypothetical protein